MFGVAVEYENWNIIRRFSILLIHKKYKFKIKESCKVSLSDTAEVCHLFIYLYIAQVYFWI